MYSRRDMIKGLAAIGGAGLGLTFADSAWADDAFIVTSAPKIEIIKSTSETRFIDNLFVSLHFKISGNDHYATIHHGHFDIVAADVLNANNGYFRGNVWMGDNFLVNAGSQTVQDANRQKDHSISRGDAWTPDSSEDPIPPSITILNRDGRRISDLWVQLNFTVNGKRHYARADIGEFDKHYILALDANGGSWDGAQWVGANFLRVVASGYDTEMNPAFMNFLNWLCIFLIAGGTAGAAFAAGKTMKSKSVETAGAPGMGGGWAPSQLR